MSSGLGLAYPRVTFRAKILNVELVGSLDYRLQAQVGMSSACLAMETTRTPHMLSMDLKATVRSRFQVNREDILIRISRRRGFGLAGLVHVLNGHLVTIALGAVSWARSRAAMDRSTSRGLARQYGKEGYEVL